MSSRLNWLYEPVALEPSLPHITITNLMHLIWQNRPDLQLAFDLQTEKGQRGFSAWLQVSAQREYGISIAQIPSVPLDPSRPLMTGGTSIYARMIGWERAFKHVAKYMPYRWRTIAKKIWYRSLSQAAQRISENDATAIRPLGASTVAMLEPSLEGPLGANLIGYAKAELGMGEHVRMSAAALATTDTNWGVFNFSDGAPTPSRQQANVGEIELLSCNKYRTNIFHINADQMFVAFCRLGHAFFEQRYNIGYWAWELPHCPASWVPLLGFVDEIWAPSRFIQDAFTAQANIPVTLMPLCVELPDFQRRSRAQLGLPNNCYLFLFTFDFLSYIERKNPYAAIRAFKQAFLASQTDVGLVIKVMNADESSPTWRRMLAIIEKDPRIFVLNQTMNRIAVLQLFDTCDAFISLHRSEGFGRGPAEAMYLGKPVIATNWSGNIDFMQPDNSCLVDYSLQPVGLGEYVFAEGQHWANPDEAHAAWYMRRLVEDQRWGSLLGAKAAAHIHKNYSSQHIGHLYEKRLKSLALV